jgi:hypothetical protein
VKTTLEIPDPVFRKAKATAAQRGQTLREFVTEAVQEKLSGAGRRSATGEPAWMHGFGRLRHLRKETRRLQEMMDDVFEVVEPEDRA